MNRTLVGALALSATLLSPTSQALDAVSLDLGHSSESTTTLRLGSQWDFARTLWQNQSGSLRLDGYWDLAATWWGHLDTASVDLSPVLRLHLGPAGGRLQPYLEAGIGLAWFSRSRLAPGTDLGSTLQFADRLGVGVHMPGGQDLSLRFFHYSNAGFNRRNSGVESLAVHYRVSF